MGSPRTTWTGQMCGTLLACPLFKKEGILLEEVEEDLACSFTAKMGIYGHLDP